MARCSSNVSEMYLRKMVPSTTCLCCLTSLALQAAFGWLPVLRFGSAASMLLRNLSAASQSLASKPMAADEGSCLGEAVLALAAGGIPHSSSPGLAFARNCLEKMPRGTGQRMWRRRWAGRARRHSLPGSTSLQVARETHKWLRLLKDTGYRTDAQAQSILADPEELQKFIGSSHKTRREKTVLSHDRSS